MFYRKQLNSLDDLQAERAKIKKKARRKAAEISKREEQRPGLLQEGIGFISGALTGNAALAPVVEMASKFAVPFLLRRGLQTGARKVAGVVLKDVAFGYVKWKALNIALRFAAKKIKQKAQKIKEEA
ncbi:hypothetical protein [Rurimicrobium arvi]|uniref:DUF3318 domain-containing protein n=1 Tax=Rurimicrobium arvi TaxID=2049916 RepID=A0ABP8MV11_9BACT